MRAAAIGRERTRIGRPINAKDDEMKWTIALLKSLRTRMGCVATFDGRRLSAQKHDLTPVEIDDRFSMLLRFGF